MQSVLANNDAIVAHPEYSLELAANTIIESALDILIYPEIGMDGFVYLLSLSIFIVNYVSQFLVQHVVLLVSCFD